VEDYSAVVLGSAVYMKRWRGEARRFLHRHRNELATRPFWIFSFGPVGDPEHDADPEWIEPRQVVAEVARLGVRGHVVFGGRLPREGGFTARAMSRNIPDEFQNRRDWDEIDAWAHRVAAELREAARAEVGCGVRHENVVVLMSERRRVGSSSRARCGTCCLCFGRASQCRG
jgi:menaquinone-dependent protoporphyrinogen oxidase